MGETLFSYSEHFAQETWFWPLGGFYRGSTYGAGVLCFVISDSWTLIGRKRHLTTAFSLSSMLLADHAEGVCCVVGVACMPDGRTLFRAPADI
jgi:hypothetical protein